MAFPVIDSIAFGGTTSGSNFTTPWPASTSVGDIVIIFGQCDGGGDTLSSDTEFTDLLDYNSGNIGILVSYAILDGTETGTFATGIDTVESGDIISIHILAANWHGTTPPEEIVGEQLVTDNPDVGELTASWGSADNLWIPFCVQDQGANTISTYPLPDNNTVATTNGNLGICSDELAQAALDPDAWLWSGADQHVAGMVVLRPAAGGGGTRPQGPFGHPFIGAFGGPI